MKIKEKIDIAGEGVIHVDKIGIDCLERPHIEHPDPICQTII